MASTSFLGTRSVSGALAAFLIISLLHCSWPHCATAESAQENNSTASAFVIVESTSENDTMSVDEFKARFPTDDHGHGAAINGDPGSETTLATSTIEGDSTVRHEAANDGDVSTETSVVTSFGEEASKEAVSTTEATSIAEEKLKTMEATSTTEEMLKTMAATSTTEENLSTSESTTEATSTTEETASTSDVTTEATTTTSSASSERGHDNNILASDSRKDETTTTSTTSSSLSTSDSTTEPPSASLQGDHQDNILGSDSEKDEVTASTASPSEPSDTPDEATSLPPRRRIPFPRRTTSPSSNVVFPNRASSIAGFLGRRRRPPGTDVDDQGHNSDDVEGSKNEEQSTFRSVIEVATSTSTSVGVTPSGVSSTEPAETTTDKLIPTTLPIRRKIPRLPRISVTQPPPTTTESDVSSSETTPSVVSTTESPTTTTEKEINSPFRRKIPRLPRIFATQPTTTIDSDVTSSEATPAVTSTTETPTTTTQGENNSPFRRKIPRLPRISVTQPTTVDSDDVTSPATETTTAVTSTTANSTEEATTVSSRKRIPRPPRILFGQRSKPAILASPSEEGGEEDVEADEEQKSDNANEKEGPATRPPFLGAGRATAQESKDESNGESDLEAEILRKQQELEDLLKRQKSTQGRVKIQSVTSRVRRPPPFVPRLITRTRGPPPGVASGTESIDFRTGLDQAINSGDLGTINEVQDKKVLDQRNRERLASAFQRRPHLSRQNQVKIKDDSIKGDEDGESVVEEQKPVRSRTNVNARFVQQLRQTQQRLLGLLKDKAVEHVAGADDLAEDPILDGRVRVPIGASRLATATSPPRHLLRTIVRHRRPPPTTVSPVIAPGDENVNEIPRRFLPSRTRQPPPTTSSTTEATTEPASTTDEATTVPVDEAPTPSVQEASASTEEATTTTKEEATRTTEEPSTTIGEATSASTTTEEAPSTAITPLATEAATTTEVTTTTTSSPPSTTAVSTTQQTTKEATTTTPEEYVEYYEELDDVDQPEDFVINLGDEESGANSVPRVRTTTTTTPQPSTTPTTPQPSTTTSTPQPSTTTTTSITAAAAELDEDIAVRALLGSHHLTRGVGLQGFRVSPSRTTTPSPEQRARLQQLVQQVDGEELGFRANFPGNQQDFRQLQQAFAGNQPAFPNQFAFPQRQEQQQQAPTAFPGQFAFPAPPPLSRPVPTQQFPQQPLQFQQQPFNFFPQQQQRPRPQFSRFAAQQQPLPSQFFSNAQPAPFGQQQFFQQQQPSQEVQRLFKRSIRDDELVDVKKRRKERDTVNKGFDYSDTRPGDSVSTIEHLPTFIGADGTRYPNLTALEVLSGSSGGATGGQSDGNLSPSGLLPPPLPNFDGNQPVKLDLGPKPPSTKAIGTTTSSPLLPPPLPVFDGNKPLDLGVKHVHPMGHGPMLTRAGDDGTAATPPLPTSDGIHHPGQSSSHSMEVGGHGMVPTMVPVHSNGLAPPMQPTTSLHHQTEDPNFVPDYSVPDTGFRNGDHGHGSGENSQSSVRHGGPASSSFQGSQPLPTSGQVGAHGQNPPKQPPPSHTHGHGLSNQQRQTTRAPVDPNFQPDYSVPQTNSRENGHHGNGQRPNGRHSSPNNLKFLPHFSLEPEDPIDDPSLQFFRPPIKFARGPTLEHLDGYEYVEPNGFYYVEDVSGRHRFLNHHQRHLWQKSRRLQLVKNSLNIFLNRLGLTRNTARRFFPPQLFADELFSPKTASCFVFENGEQRVSVTRIRAVNC